MAMDGKQGCKCMNETSFLASLVKRSCKTSDGKDGVQLKPHGPCVPPSYGSGSCRRHDMIHDPKCSSLLEEQGNTSSTISTPNYCLQSWCYVDAPTCRRHSTERVYRSDYFSHDSGLDLFYSYSTCGSEDDWVDYQQGKSLGGISISAIIPEYSYPMMYKRNADGEILNSVGGGDEYYDSNVPYEGVLITYFDKLIDIADGDFSINYTYASEANRLVHPKSNYTAAIQDVRDGLADMVIAQTWISEERLQLASFTVPLYYDRTVLAIPKPSDDQSVNAQIKKTLEPFEPIVWFLILLLIAITAMVSTWMSWYGKSPRQKKRRDKVKKRVYARLLVDEFLQKGMFFCSAGVEQDKGDTLPQKLLMSGFAFFILITVSAYVANLAAFLTQPILFVGNIETVTEKGQKVCAHPVIQKQLKVAWPNTRFVFGDRAYSGMVDRYKNGECDFLAVSEANTNSGVIAKYCKNDIVLTDSLVLEIPVAFAIRPELASGISYWMTRGEQNFGITLEDAQKEYADKHQQQTAACSVKFDAAAHEASDYTQISPGNLAFPLLIWTGFLLLAILMQLWHQRASANGDQRGTVLGRISALSRAYSNRLHNTKAGSIDRYELPVPPDATDGNGEGGEGQVLSDTVQPTNNENDSVRRRTVKFATDDPPDTSDEFHECFDGTTKENDARSRVHRLIETGAFDDFLEYVEERQKEN